MIVSGSVMPPVKHTFAARASMLLLGPPRIPNMTDRDWDFALLDHYRHSDDTIEARNSAGPDRPRLDATPAGTRLSNTHKITVPTRLSPASETTS